MKRAVGLMASALLAAMMCCCAGKAAAQEVVADAPAEPATDSGAVAPEGAGDEDAAAPAEHDSTAAASARSEAGSERPPDIVMMNDGRRIRGMITSSDATRVTIRGVDNQELVFPRSRVTYAGPDNTPVVAEVQRAQAPRRDVERAPPAGRVGRVPPPRQVAQSAGFETPPRGQAEHSHPTAGAGIMAGGIILAVMGVVATVLLAGADAEVGAFLFPLGGLAAGVAISIGGASLL